MEAFNTKPIVIVTDLYMATGAAAIRAGLEAFGLRTSVFLCPFDTSFRDILEGKLPDCDTIIFDCHGDDGKMLFLQIAGETGFHDFTIAPKDITKQKCWQNTLVISLGCTTGNGELAQAFLAAGCRGFIGPNGTPHVHTTLLFPLMFYRHLLQHVGLGVDKPQQMSVRRWKPRASSTRTPPCLRFTRLRRSSQLRT